MNVFTKHRVTDVGNKLTVTKEEKGGGGDKLGAWDRHTHTTIYKIDNKNYGMAQGTLLNTL